MDRKTLDQRAQMSDLERLRHSAAHVMATAIAKLWPDAQFAAGPPVEDGFYYDVDLQHRISPEDFPKIEAEMKAVVKANQVFEKVTVTRDQALADAQAGRPAGPGARGGPGKIKNDNIQRNPPHQPDNQFKNRQVIYPPARAH